MGRVEFNSRFAIGTAILTAVFIGANTGVPLPASADPLPGAPQPYSAPAPSSPASQPPSPFPFAVVGTDTADSSGHEAVYDFGTLVQGSSAPVQHDFTLRNTSGSTVNVQRVQASCGCTTAMLDIGTPGAYKPIAPGQQFTVHVSVAADHLFPPHADKQVMLYLTGFGSPAETLRIEGTVVPAVSFDPAFLNFGTVQAGDTPSIHVKITIDKKAYAWGTTPISSDPFVRVRKDRDQPQSDSKGDLQTTSYSVEIDKRHGLGSSQSTLTMPGSASVRPGLNAIEWIQVDVKGDISVRPNSVAFGLVNVGRSASQKIIVNATSKNVLDGLTVECLRRQGPRSFTPSPDLTAQLDRGAAAGPDPSTGASCTLDVTVTPHQEGALQDSVIALKTASGQELDMPVYAYANAPTPSLPTSPQ